MALEQPKKPVGGAYGSFLADKRPEFTKACEGQKASAISTMAGEAWKKLSEADKQPYQQKYEVAKAKYEKDIAVFLAAGGEKTKGAAALRKEKRNAKDGKKQKDRDAPKKPVGGAYGVFNNEKRDEFKAQMEAAGDKSFGGGAKLASAAWKALSDEEKKPYEEKYKAAYEKYTAEMADYKASKPEEETDSLEDSPKKKSATPEKTSPPKRAASSEVKTAPATKRKVAKADATPSVVLDAALLKEADGLGYRAGLENLANRKDILEKQIDGAKLLGALRAADGLVNKAKAALLGA